MDSNDYERLYLCEWVDYFLPISKISIKRECRYISLHFHISTTESQKGVNDVPSGNQKGAIWILYSNYSALLVLNGTYLNCINALLALN